MGELVLLVIGAAWAAVLIPPLLRSRIENRPNSSVTDFRRQLNKLESTVPSRAGAPMRGMARPLAQTPLQRPAAGGRPGMQPAQIRRSAGRSHGGRTATLAPPHQPTQRRRTHGDPTGGHPRPHHEQGQQHRQTHVARHGMSAAEQLRRRRSNVLFMLVLVAGSTLFLAATTQAAAMLYLFALAFLALCGYAYLLSQARQREAQSWPTDWMHS
ncbi:MAG: hypothetical protein QNJ12_02860 [Ilumatobacter sp.]|uniref:hypothetical protein n=1 Tax=Ilumatobacter sp. TaxID=1967498 RepID=UPI002622173C|nr:hypothetical protein [Ilumatobacter sp.]MDJ0767700.1 hypothetical protein [Ilumatobacter sp.]